MKRLLPAVFAIVFLSIAVPSLAIETPQVTFYPSSLSANSSFVMVVDPSATPTESVAVHWVVGGEAYSGTTFAKMGSVPKVGSKWVCYFSSTDPASTCGPTPFTRLTTGYVPYQMLIYAGNQYEDVTNTTIDVDAGGIALTPKIDYTDSGISMTVWASGPLDSIQYKTYYASGSKMMELVPGKSGTLDYKPEIFGFAGSLDLDKNVEYYIAFTGNTSSDHAGGIVKVGGSSQSTLYSEINAEDFTWQVTVNEGETKTNSRFSITNIGTDNMSDLTMEVPTDWQNNIEISLQDTSLDPNEESVYTVNLKNINSAVTINTEFILKSSGTIIKRIPATIYVSYEGSSTGTGFCTGEPDGTNCNGGVCCSDTCVSGGQCCSSSDCRAGEACSQNMCQASSSVCSSGTCYQGTLGGDCPVGTSYTFETCTTALGQNGVCCLAASECQGKNNGDTCSSGTGLCCSGSCISGAQCCSDSDCPGSQICNLNKVCESSSSSGGSCATDETCKSMCDATETATSTMCTLDTGDIGICCVGSGSSGGLDMGLVTMIIIAVIVVIVVFIVFKKFGSKITSKLKRGGKEEKSDEEYFEDDEFY